MSRYSSSHPLIVGIDGRSGSGKTVLSKMLVENLSAQHTVTVLRMEDLYPGWNGLHDGMEIFSRDVLPKLAAGETATYQTWDWHSEASSEGGFGAVVTTEPTEVIICEGVGVGARANRDLLDVLIWLRVPIRSANTKACNRTAAAMWGRGKNGQAQSGRR